MHVIEKSKVIKRNMKDEEKGRTELYREENRKRREERKHCLDFQINLGPFFR
jgi:hypothetical protein